MVNGLFVRGDDEVDGEGACEFGLGGGEDVPLVVDWDVGGFHGCPEGLQVAVEEEWVEAAGRRGGAA